MCAWNQAFSCSVCASGVPRETFRGGASIPPGAVATTRIPWSAYSQASDAVSALTPPLAAEYGMRWMPRAAADETLTIVPCRRSTMNGRTARQHHRVGKSDRRISATICVLGELDVRLEVDRAADVVDQDVDPAEAGSAPAAIDRRGSRRTARDRR